MIDNRVSIVMKTPFFCGQLDGGRELLKNLTLDKLMADNMNPERGLQVPNERNPFPIDRFQCRLPWRHPAATTETAYRKRFQSNLKNASYN